MRATTCGHGFHQQIDTFCFTSTAWTESHHAMPYTLCLKKLNYLHLLMLNRKKKQYIKKNKL